MGTTEVKVAEKELPNSRQQSIQHRSTAGLKLSASSVEV